MTRYYYENWLAAAWMAENHGLHFETANSSPLYWDGGNFRLEKTQAVSTASKFYVRNNALRVGSEFRPRPGDIVMFIIDDGSIAVDAVETVYEPEDESYPYVGNGYEAVVHLCASHPDWLHESRIRIIQRNSTPFHWPKQEEL